MHLVSFGSLLIQNPNTSILLLKEVKVIPGTIIMHFKDQRCFKTV